MRTPLLCALTLLCGAEIAYAQQSPTYSTNGYYQGYGAGNQMSPGYYGSNGYSQSARPTSYAPYYQGYGNYPSQGYGNYPGQAYGNYPNSYSYPNYMARNQYYYQTYYPRNYPYPQSTYPSATQQVAATTTNADQMPPVQPPVVAAPPVQEVCVQEAASVEPAGPPPCKERVWTAAGYEMSFIRSQRLQNPLVTTGSITDTNTGAIGQPGTGVLFGGPIDYGVFSGARAEIGVYLDDNDTFSIEMSGQYSFENSVKFGKASDATGVPVITRPDFNVVTGMETAFLDAFPGISSGSVAVLATSQFWGAEFDASYHCQPCEHLHLEGLAGFRYLHLAESLTIQDQLAPLQDNVLTFNGPTNFVNAPSSLADQDQFRTTNNFYGFHLGSRIEWVEKWFSLGGYAKVGFGATDEIVDINGSTTLFSPMGNQITSGGVLALPSNIGHYDRTIFTVVPEVGINLAVNVTPHMQLTAGYSFLYWNQVVRPAAQIDHSINTSMVPTDVSFGSATGPVRPVFNFNDEAFWIHALTFGVDLHY